MNSSSLKTGLIQFGILLLATLIASSAAIYNGYPLVYPDTGTYINSGFLGIAPGDRPIFYGLFLRHVSLYYSLWLVVFTQTFIAVYVIKQTLSIFITQRLNLILIVSVAVLSLLSAFSFVTGLLIPDMFTALSILSIIILWFKPNLKKYETVLLYLIFIFSIVSHFSNILIMIALIISCYVINYFMNRKNKGFIKWVKINRTSLALLFSLFLVPFSNYLGGKKFSLSETSHVFVYNHLREIGLTKIYLEENCTETNSYKMCNYINDDTPDFMWNLDSPLYKTGGWEANKNEFNEIIRNILSTPKYWKKLVASSIDYSGRQFITFKTKIHGTEIIPGGPVYGQMEWRFPEEMESYLTSRQNTKQHDLTFLNIIHSIIFYLSLGFLLAITFGILGKGDEFYSLRFIGLLLLLFSMYNAIICSNLSIVVDRFQNRLVWVFLLFSIIAISTFYTQRKYDETT